MDYISLLVIVPNLLATVYLTKEKAYQANLLYLIGYLLMIAHNYNGGDTVQLIYFVILEIMTIYAVIKHKRADTSTRTAYITVTSKPVKPNAFYGVSSTTGRSPWTIKYTDLSTGNPTKWLWVFGDGATSTQQNPTHTFRWTYGDGSPDVYPTSLTVSNSVGSSTVSGYSRVV